MKEGHANSDLCLLKCESIHRQRPQISRCPIHKPFPDPGWGSAPLLPAGHCRPGMLQRSKDTSFEGRCKTEQLGMATAKPSPTNLLVGIDTAQHGDKGLARKAEGHLTRGRRTS